MSSRAKTSLPDVILHVINSLGISGGAEQQLISNLNHFDDPRFEHHIAYIYQYGFENRGNAAKEVAASVRPLLPPGSRRSRLQTINHLDAVVRDVEPALIHCSLADASLAARVVGWRRNIPVVESLVNIAHDPIRLVDSASVKPWKLGAHRSVDRITMRRVEAFHALSEAVAKSWHESVGISLDRIHVIPRGVDAEQLRAQAVAGPTRQDLAEELSFDPDSTIMLTVGRHEPQKGHRYLIEALPQILSREPDTVLLVAGRPGSMSEILIETARALGVDSVVRFLGRRADVAALITAADVFVFPSLFEGLGVTLLEALAIGTPVAASDIEPITDLIEDKENGRLFTPQTPTDIAAVLIALLNDVDQRQRLSKAGQLTIARRYPARAAAQGLERLYREVLDSTS